MLRNTIVIGWGLGSLGLAVILNTLNVLLMAYLTLVIGFEPAFAGSVILLAKLYDVVTDLPMGWITDRTRSRWGSRRPYMLAAALITPISLFMLFSTPIGNKVMYVTAALLLYATGYTLFNVPYLSMPAELSPDTHTRTRMVAWRSLFIAGGTMFGIALAPFMIGRFGDGAPAYEVLGKTIAVVVGLAFLFCVLMTGQPQSSTAATKSAPITSQLRTIARNSHFRALIMIKITHLLALSVGGGSLLVFFKFVIQHALQTLGLYGALITIVWALTMPIWVRVAGNRGKRYGYFLATAAYSAIVLSWFLADAGESNLGLVTRGIAFGIVSGGLLLMGNAMLQDIMDDDFRRTEFRKNGMFAGSYSMIEKITSGIGAQILGIVLSMSGFSRIAETQSESAIQGIYVAVAGIPGVLMLISLIFIARYRLNESRLGS